VVEEFQGFNKGSHGFHAGDAIALEQGVVECICSGREEVWLNGYLGALSERPVFSRDYRFPEFAGDFGGAGEGRDHR